jgi:ABC-type transporter Mla subunit MlaD
VVGNLSQVAADLANLVGTNHQTLTNTISSLQVVAADIQAHQQELANGLATLGQGLAPYIQISQWGQWFAVQTVYTCLAGQTVCPYYQPATPPAGSGPFGSPPLPAPLSKVTTPGLPAAPNQSTKGASASPSIDASSLSQILGAVSGQKASSK